MKDEFISHIKNNIKSINDFSCSVGLKVKPFPNVFIDQMKQTKLQMHQGLYVPSEMLIILNVNGRHIHDILRTYCHELIHHEQNLLKKGRLNYMKSDLCSYGLINIEIEAYTKGNLLFDKWIDFYSSK